MAEVARDLTDDQIEKLLSAAEASLASKPAGQAVAPKAKQQDVHALAKAGVAKPGNAKDDSAAVKAPEELTLRVPQLKSKDKKVRFLPSQLDILLHDESNSQTRMTRRRAPVLGADPAPPMIYFCS